MVLVRRLLAAGPPDGEGRHPARRRRRARSHIRRTVRRAPQPAGFSNVTSSDGSRVFWSTVENDEAPEEQSAARPIALYAREHQTSSSAATVQLDGAQAGAEGASGKGQFWTASTYGSRVFFTDCNRLTEGSTAISSEGCQQSPAANDSPRTGNDLYL